MCVTCGCSEGAQAFYTRPEQENKSNFSSTDLHSHSHTHALDDGTVITHVHHSTTDHVQSTHGQSDHHHHHDHYGEQVYPDGPPSSSVSVTRLTQHAHTHAKTHRTTVTLEQKLLEKNNLIAGQNRSWLEERSITALNLVSSPGSGKTSLLVKTIEDLKSEVPIAVIEGDQETANDAERIAKTGCPTIQVNTGTGCHLEAFMVKHGLDSLKPPDQSLVLIENVGNLVCPALFDLGEKAKVAVLSVTEGEDKPLKYPHMFRASQVMVLTKTDLLPYVQFDVEQCIDYAKRVNPELKVFQVSVVSTEGLTSWYQWLREQARASW